jgi:hypothetical protein
VTVGVDLVVIYDNVVAADNPVAALELAGRSIDNSNLRTVLIGCEKVVMLLGVDNRELTALEAEGLARLNALRGHSSLGAVERILSKIGDVCAEHHNARI